MLDFIPFWVFFELSGVNPSNLTKIIIDIYVMRCINITIHNVISGKANNYL